MSDRSLKSIAIVAALIAAGMSAFYATRRTPVCAGDGKYMSTDSECRAWGFSEGVCADAIEKAHAVATRAAPKSDTSFKCELRFSECFQTPSGEFAPRPSFCLRAGGAPSEIRYLEYESDRMNRKKTKEVRID